MLLSESRFQPGRLPRGFFDKLGSLSFRTSACSPPGLFLDYRLGWCCGTAVGWPNQTVVIAPDLAITERPRRAESPCRNCGLDRIG